MHRLGLKVPVVLVGAASAGQEAWGMPALPLQHPPFLPTDSLLTSVIATIGVYWALNHLYKQQFTGYSIT